MMHDKYGSVATSGELMLLDLVEAQRRTNELLEKMFILQQHPVQTVTVDKEPKAPTPAPTKAAEAKTADKPEHDKK